MADDGAIATVPIHGFSPEHGGLRPQDDRLAVEAPLEIRLRAPGGEAEPLSITMRTPGHDAELALGFLFSEGLVRARSEVAGVRVEAEDAVTIDLSPGVSPPAVAQRRFTTTSACGVCGKATTAALAIAPPYALPAAVPSLPAAMLAQLPDRLRAAQPAFAATGGLHAAGLFDAAGALLLAREDVGRHNAVDKVVGARFEDDTLPSSGCVLCVSGRASFELVAKAIMAGIPALVAVGAPSTLAVELAATHGLTLLGFTREQRFNVYTGSSRLLERPR